MGLKAALLADTYDIGEILSLDVSLQIIPNSHLGGISAEKAHPKFGDGACSG